jgi:hypothetical protein
MIPVKKLCFYQDTAVKNNQQIHISALYLDEQGKTEVNSQDKAVFYRLDRVYLITPMDGKPPPPPLLHPATHSPSLSVASCLCTDPEMPTEQILENLVASAPAAMANAPTAETIRNMNGDKAVEAAGHHVLVGLLFDVNQMRGLAGVEKPATLKQVRFSFTTHLFFLSSLSPNHHPHPHHHHHHLHHHHHHQDQFLCSGVHTVAGVEGFCN